MNLELTPEQLALRESLRRYLTSLPGGARPTLDYATETSETAWQGLAELGLTGLLIPEKYDGADATMADAGIVLEELGRALDPGPWLSTAVAVPRALARLGLTDTAETLLTGIAAGSTIAAMDVGGAHDPAVIALRPNESAALRRTESVMARQNDSVAPQHESMPPRQGESTLLDGTVADIADAAAAHVLLVFAREEDTVGLYAVESSAPGVELVAKRGVDASHERFRLTLHETPARRLGATTPAAIDALVDDVLIAAAADALGAAQALLELVLEYATIRKQFGRSIGTFQAVQHLCVDMFETVELARSGVIRGLWAADAGTEDERHGAAIAVKAFAGRLATVGETAIQVFGGIGFTWEHDAHRYFERLLSWSAFLGSPDRYLREVGSRLAGARHRSPTS